MQIFAKFCCIVGQIVVGAILGLLWARFAFRLIDWMDDIYWTLKKKWKSRTSKDSVLAK